MCASPLALFEKELPMQTARRPSGLPDYGFSMQAAGYRQRADGARVRTHLSSRDPGVAGSDREPFCGVIEDMKQGVTWQSFSLT